VWRFLRFPPQILEETFPFHTLRLYSVSPAFIAWSTMGIATMTVRVLFPVIVPSGILWHFKRAVDAMNGQRNTLPGNAMASNAHFHSGNPFRYDDHFLTVIESSIHFSPSLDRFSPESKRRNHRDCR
jgi:hypothetical protein